MGDYELYTPWLRQKIDRHPRTALPVLSVTLFLLVYAGVYKGVTAIQEHAQSRLEQVVIETP